MSAESQVNTTLNAYAGLTAVVAARIYPDFLAQEIALPAVVYQRGGTEYVTTIHNGTPLDARVTMELWCLATSRDRAETLANLVELAIANTFLPIDRRPEFDDASATFSTVISVTVWPS